MDIFRIVMLGVVAAMLAVLIKGSRPEIALLLSLSAGILLLLLALNKLTSIMDFADKLAQKYGLKGEYLILALKIVGIAIVADFGTQLCKDAGENSIASKVELGGKLIVLTLALPVIAELLKIVSSIL